MYNGIGIATPRGSGTSGYVQKSLAFYKQQKTNNNYKEILNQFKANPAPIRKQANEEILKHEVLFKIESELYKIRISKESAGLSSVELEIFLNTERERLQSEYFKKVELDDDTKKENHTDFHRQNLLKEKHNEKLKEAFKISESYTSGDAFDIELQEQKNKEAEKRRAKEKKEKEKRYQEKQKKDERRVLREERKKKELELLEEFEKKERQLDQELNPLTQEVKMVLCESANIPLIKEVKQECAANTKIKYEGNIILKPVDKPTQDNAHVSNKGNAEVVKKDKEKESKPLGIKKEDNHHKRHDSRGYERSNYQTDRSHYKDRRSRSRSRTYSRSRSPSRKHYRNRNRSYERDRSFHNKRRISPSEKSKEKKIKNEHKPKQSNLDQAIKRRSRSRSESSNSISSSSYTSSQSSSLTKLK